MVESLSEYAMDAIGEAAAATKLLVRGSGAEVRAKFFMKSHI